MIKKQVQSDVGIIQSEISIEGCTYTTYGIKYNNFTLEDVSTDRYFVEEILKKIKDENIEDCHIMDFIQDETERNA